MTNSRLTKKQSELIHCVERLGPTSIYQLAKEVGRPYRRVFDNIKMLEGNGMVLLEPSISNNRKVILVASNDPVYQRMLRYEADTKSDISGVLGKLREAVDADVVLTGQLCAAIYGVEINFKRIELCTVKGKEEIESLLSDMEGEFKISMLADVQGRWLAEGAIDGVSFTISTHPVPPVETLERTRILDIQLAGIREVVSYLCRNGDSSSIEYVAAIALMDKGLKWYVMTQAERYGIRSQLDSNLNDPQLIDRYGLR